MYFDINKVHILLCELGVVQYEIRANFIYEYLLCSPIPLKQHILNGLNFLITNRYIIANNSAEFIYNILIQCALIDDKQDNDILDNMRNTNIIKYY